MVHAGRIAKLQKGIEEGQGVLLERPMDLFYLTGLSFSVGRLLATRSQIALFVDGRYWERARREAGCEVRFPEEFGKALQGLKEVVFDRLVRLFLKT